MNIDKVTITTMLVFSFSIRSSSNNSNSNRYRRLIPTYLNSVTGTRTHIFFTFSRFFSLSLQSLYTWCCLFAQSLPCMSVFACMCITMAGRIYVYLYIQSSFCHSFSVFCHVYLSFS